MDKEDRKFQIEMLKIQIRSSQMFTLNMTILAVLFGSVVGLLGILAASATTIISQVHIAEFSIIAAVVTFVIIIICVYHCVTMDKKIEKLLENELEELEKKFL